MNDKGSYQELTNKTEWASTGILTVNAPEHCNLQMLDTPTLSWWKKKSQTCIYQMGKQPGDLFFFPGALGSRTRSFPRTSHFSIPRLRRCMHQGAFHHVAGHLRGRELRFGGRPRDEERGTNVTSLGVEEKTALLFAAPNYKGTEPQNNTQSAKTGKNSEAKVIEAEPFTLTGEVPTIRP